MNNIFQIIEGFIKVSSLLLVAIIIIIYIFIKKGGEQYVKNWVLHKNNPSVMPFAGMLGKNTSNNTRGVFYTFFKTNFSFMIKPIQYIINLVTKIIGNLLHSMNIFRTILKPIRDFFTQAATSFYDKINNFSIMIVYFFSKMRNLLRRVASTFRLTLYTLQSLHLTMKSVWNGPIGEVSRDWGYAVDNLRDFFCFHQDTPIKLHNNITIPISKLKIGDKIINNNDNDNDNDNYDLVTGISIAITNATDLYKVDDIIMTKSHLVISNNKWVTADKLGEYVGKSSNEYIYCPITKSHELLFNNNLITKDFVELEDFDNDSYILNYNLSNLNKTPHNYRFDINRLNTLAGISSDSYVNIDTDKYLKAKDIKIGSQLSGGKVLAIIVFQLDNNNTYDITPTLNITSRQIIYDNTNNKWGLYNYDKLASDKIDNVNDNNNNLYYSFYTTSGYYKCGIHLLTDMYDGQSPQDIEYTNTLIKKKLNQNLIKT